MGSTSPGHCPENSTPGDQDDFSQGPGQEATAPPAAPASWRLTILAAGLIVLSAIAAYHGSLVGPFLYDDDNAIVDNPTIRQLWPIGQVLSPPPDGDTVSGRPLLNFSLAINYAIGGLNVRGYHATNLAIHIAAALLLFGILRRTFLLPALRDRFGGPATPLALAGALLWTVHPLQTESVTYIVQRAESLAGFFYLLTLYCVIRGGATAGLSSSAGSTLGQAGHRPKVRRGTHAKKGTVPLGSPSPCATASQKQCESESAAAQGTVPFSLRENWDSPLLWYIAAVLACLLGMACKEIMVTAPLIVLLYDRTFLAGSFREAWRRRWGLYLGLAATWGLLGYLVLSTGLIGRQSELGAPDPWSYARTQPGVILHYLRLSVWPSPLCFDYAWPVAEKLGEILPGAIVVGVLLAATVWGLMGRKPWGFLGAWFFLILAPTSSMMPLRQVTFEHRMYLSLAAIAVLAAAGGYALWDRLLPRPAGQGGQSPFSPGMTLGALGWWGAKKGTVPAAEKGTVPARAAAVRWAAPVTVWAAVLLALGCATAARNRDYRSLLAIWQDTVDKRPSNPAAHYSLGIALAAAGRTDEAIEHYRQALRLKPDYAQPCNNLAVFLVGLGRIDEGIEHYYRALQLKPDYADAHNNLANVLTGVGKCDEAIEHCHEALRLKPDYADAHNNLGNALAGSGRFPEAVEHYQQALRLKTDFAAAHNNLAASLAALDRTDAAIEHYHEALRLNPDYAEAHNNLGLALAAAGKTQQAMEHFQEALRLKPDLATAHHNLGNNLVKVGKTQEAIEHYHEALRLNPAYSLAHYNLANVLFGAGRSDEAIEHYRQALRLNPQSAEAHNNLANVLFGGGRTGEAIEHYQHALRLKPDYAKAHNNLASVLFGAGRSDEAIEHYQQALRLTPDDVTARCNLARILASVGRTAESVEHYSQVLQRAPDSAAALGELAWLLATSEPAPGSDPARAIRLAQRARELSSQENPQCLDTLAAAYAAAGRFSDAVITAQRAAELAESSGQTTLARRIQSRLELYRAGRAYREAPSPPGQTKPD